MSQSFRKAVRELGVIFALSTAVVAAPLAFHRAPASLPSVPPVPESLAGRLSLLEFQTFVQEKRGLIIDARPAANYSTGHIPGALNLGVENFDRQYAPYQTQLETNRHQPIVVYCSNAYCRAADTVRKKLEARGYQKVTLFAKGWAAWQEAALPEEKSEAENR